MKYEISKSNIMAKARRLVKDDCVIKVDDDLYQVPSSSQKDKVYVIQNFECMCVGYKIHGLCSHSEAVRLLEKNKNE